MTLDPPTLARALGPRLRSLPHPAPPPARGVRFDSRQVRPGDAFVALVGAREHGVAYAAEATARGAAFVISDRPYPGAVLVDDAAAALRDLGRYARSQHRGARIGVTGSVGKTTTKALLGAALAAFVTPGNLNTPHALATVMIDAWLGGATEQPWVLELGIDHAGEMARLLDLVAPTIGVVTAIAPAHLAGIGDLAAVAFEKSRLLAVTEHARFASVAAAERLSADARGGVIRYGLGDRGEVRGRLRAGEERDTLVANLGERVDVPLPGVGRALAENALGALTVAWSLGVTPTLAAERIAATPALGGRLRRHDQGARTLIDDSYNANPASVVAALEILTRGARPRMLVLGAMRELGPESAALHREIGAAIAAAALDGVWTVGDEALPVGDAVAVAAHFADAEAATAACAALPRDGTLLVKGSRGIGLERLVEALLAQGPRTPEVKG
jgi:UDP-N-acetylmuramoyl-tripeptide--D-alanyl-D-alanine ligase